MGAGVRDVFPPPIVVWIVYAFRLGGLRVAVDTVWADYEWAVGFVWLDYARGWIACKWLFGLCGMRGKILRKLVGAVPVCPPVSPCKGASVVKFPAHNACIFGMETPLCGRSGGHTGAAPTVSFGQIAHETVDFVWGWIVHDQRISFGR